MHRSVKMLIGVAIVALMVAGCGGDTGPGDDTVAGDDGSTTSTPSEPATSGGTTSGETTPGDATTIGGEGTTTGPPSSSPVPVPPVVTADDDEGVFSLGPDSSASLQLDNSVWLWEVSGQDGESVELVPVDYFADPGFTEWLVEPRTGGTTTVSIGGDPACDDPAECPPRTITLTFVVEG